MKKILFLFAVLLLTQAGTVQADTDLKPYPNVIYVAPATIYPGYDGSEATLSICMNNTARIRGFQFDLYLPEGMTAVKSSKGKFVVSLNDARLPEDDEHTLTVAEQGDGAIRFLCNSQYDETFTGTSGEVATIKVSVAGLAAGWYPITLKGIKLSETDISNYHEVAEVVTTFIVRSSAGPEGSGTDYSAYSNVIYVAPATIYPSEEGNETKLSICMNNMAQIRGFQFDLYLPRGMTAVKSSKGKFVVSLNSGRLPEDDEHTVTTAEQGDGAIRFLCASQYDETFTGTSGEIATIKVDVANLAVGKYPITLRGIKLSETNISNYYEVAEIVTMFTVEADKTVLNSTIAEADDFYGRIVNDYADIAATLLEAINEAKGVQADEDASQEEVDAAVDALNNALQAAKDAIATGISVMKADARADWYDLQGRRLDTRPTAKGVYINGGRKVVMK